MDYLTIIISIFSLFVASVSYLASRRSANAAVISSEVSKINLSYSISEQKLIKVGDLAEKILRNVHKVEFILDHMRNPLPEFISSYEGSAPDQNSLSRLKIYRDEIDPTLRDIEEDLYLMKIIYDREKISGCIREIKRLIIRVNSANVALMGYEKNIDEYLQGRVKNTLGMEEKINLAISKMGSGIDPVKDEFSALKKRIADELGPMIQRRYEINSGY